jgi:hypothetical protein
MGKTRKKTSKPRKKLKNVAVFFTGMLHWTSSEALVWQEQTIFSQVVGILIFKFV